MSGNALVETALLYHCLNLTHGTIHVGGVATREAWVLQTCLAVLASGDPSIDGIWFSDLHGQAFPSDSGGIYQNRLSTIGGQSVAVANSIASSPALWEPTSFLV